MPVGSGAPQWIYRRSGRNESQVMSQVHRRLAAVVFTDMVGFTSAAQKHETIALDLLREQENLVRPIVDNYGGREVKSTGDGFLLEFPSALKAAECSIEIQTRLHERNANRELQAIRLRIGINVGDVESRDSDIFGDAVNTAARVLTVAEPEGIALTEQAAHYLQNRLGYPLESLGTRDLKGIDRPVPVFRIVLPWSGPAQVSRARVLPRVAVLPLRNISPDPNDEYFADGMTEELISVLGQVRELRVISRSSVARFKGQDHPISDIGRELDASAVLEGSVRKAGSRLRISLQLVDVASQEGLWTQTFDRNLDDVFAVQAEVSERTAASLRVRLMGEEREALSRPPTASLAAYGLYLQGIHLSRGPREEDKSNAAEFFRKAIAEDPTFSAAFSQLANNLLGSIGERNPAQKVLPEARYLIEKALSLDPNSCEAHTAKGNMAMQGDLNWAIAEAEFRRALELKPSAAETRAWYSLLLRALQRYSEAREQCRTVIELDPLNAGAYALTTSLLRLIGDFDEAEKFLRNSTRGFLTPGQFHVTMAYTYSYWGKAEEARRELDEGERLGEKSSFDVAVLRARLGDPSDARSKLAAAEKKRASGEYVPVLNLAVLAAVTGDANRAIDYLEKDWSEGDRGLWFIYQGAGFDPVRSDPRFIRLLERYGVPISAPFFRWGRAT